MQPHPYIGWARPQTFDETRTAPRICGCQQHWITGAPQAMHCPWKREPTPATWGATWAQPEQEPLSE